MVDSLAVASGLNVHHRRPERRSPSRPSAERHDRFFSPLLTPFPNFRPVDLHYAIEL
jgi:hypothetical protein